MKLQHEFYRLPFAFDAERLQRELASIPAEAWVHHPSGYAGNSHVRLISSGGGENDDVGGAMAPTPHLQRLPFIAQVLASFGVVWSRSRLMRLAPGAVVPEHSDINYHWFNRVRVHIPIVTTPEVRFYCGGKSVHMAAGEAWIFDNWRRHRVENRSNVERVHLVADTTGSASFWKMVTEAHGGQARARVLDLSESATFRLMTEGGSEQVVMPPAEVELLVGDLLQDLAVADGADSGSELLLEFRFALESFCRDWRQLWVLFGDRPEGLGQFARLRSHLREHLASRHKGLVMRSIGVSAQQVLEARVLRHALAEAQPLPRTGRSTPAPPRLDRPLIIVAAPRSGSTLLFETLSVTPQLWHFGGEAHWLIEGHSELRPGAPGVDSNRLLADHCTEDLRERILQTIAARVTNVHGERWDGRAVLRLLEKTPKNSLRIPFLERLFPGARYLFLWRDPQENISSIIEAWRDGRWITYPDLPGRDGPWSLLLPQGWQRLGGRPIEEVAAFQWQAANETVLNDLARLSSERSLRISYAQLVSEPEAVVRRVCDFAELDFDAALRARCAQPLPLSRYTQTPPSPEKWRNNRQHIERILPTVGQTWARLIEAT